MTCHPFLSDPPQTIPLSVHSPIERVIAQVKFPPLHLGEKKGLPVAFHDLVCKEFPYSAEMRMLQVEWTPEGGDPRQVEAQSVSYRYPSADKQWELYLGNDFISMVCLRYDTREEFHRRFLLAMEAAAQCLDIVYWGRLGLRYVNRGPKSPQDVREQYATMLKPEYRGIIGTALFEKTTNSLVTAEWDLDGVFASVRHGYLAPGTTYDPFSVPPSNNPGWILDLDVYMQPERFGLIESFSAPALALKFTELADREYCIFRELVTEEFVGSHGGNR
jgi:uncharacterized protein (TIGR04255 family)